MDPTTGQTATPAAPVAAPVAETSPEPKGQSITGWLRSAFTRNSRSVELGSPTSDPEPARATPSTESTTPAPETAPAPKTITLTEEELERRAQSRADKILARQARDTEIARRRDERTRLRDTDPLQFAELDRQQEEAQAAANQQGQALESTVFSLARSFDGATVDVLMQQFDPKEAAKVLDEAGDTTGIPGRQRLTEVAVKALVKKAKADGAAEAEQRLRRNPAFRKQLYAENRGETEEPPLVAAAGSVPPPMSMNDWIRGRATG